MLYNVRDINKERERKMEEKRKEGRKEDKYSTSPKCQVSQKKSKRKS